MTKRVKAEIGLSLLSGAFFVLTMEWPEWIEAVLKVSPDAGSGWAEWAISATLLTIAAAFAFLARIDYRRVAALPEALRG